MQDIVALAQELLPDGDLSDWEIASEGQFHIVAAAPDRGVVRVARRDGDADEMKRVAALCTRLAACDLPFQIPVPLTDVVDHDGRAAVAMTWVEGQPAPKGEPRLAGARDLLDALQSIDLAELDGLLAPPRAYAGGAQWHELMSERVVPSLPADLQQEAHERIEAVVELDPPPPSLVHGDLAGDNVRWRGETVTGVLDWDLASAWDPAVDAACLAWHGWDTVRATVDDDTYRRAITYYRVFGLEQIAADILADASPAQTGRTVERIASWMRDPPEPELP